MRASSSSSFRIAPVTLTGLPDVERPARVAPPHRSPNRKLRNCMVLEYDDAGKVWHDVLKRADRGGVALPLNPRSRPVGQERVRFDAVGPSKTPSNRWDDPVLVGLLLCLAPPIGILALWSSTAIPHSGKVAVTAFAGLCVAAVTTVAVALCLAN